jgi:phage shock protein A
MHLKQHKLATEKVEHVSKIEKELGEYGVKLNQLEDLHRILNAVQESGGDPQKLVEFVKGVESLRTQTEVETRNLTETREKRAKLREEISVLEKKLNETELVIEKCQKLESMGWCSENLERAINLAKNAGSPDEALSRLELLRPSTELRADLDNITVETAHAASRKRKLKKKYDTLKKRFRNFKDTTNAMMDLFKMGFTKQNLLSIQDIASRYGSFPTFIEAFGRYNHLKNIEIEIKKLEEKREALKDDLERMQGETGKLDAKKEEVALKTGRLKAEMEQMMKAISGLKFYTVFADDPRSLTIDSAAWLTERIRIWAENKQTEIEKKTFLTSELKVGDMSRWLCESIRKLRERGH